MPQSLATRAYLLADVQDSFYDEKGIENVQARLQQTKRGARIGAKTANTALLRELSKTRRHDP